MGTCKGGWIDETDVGITCTRKAVKGSRYCAECKKARASRPRPLSDVALALVETVDRADGDPDFVGDADLAVARSARALVAAWRREGRVK